jgi:hypothetical protein
MLNPARPHSGGHRRTAEARQDAQQALALLRAGTEQPGAGGEAFNEYAWALVSTEVEDIRNQHWRFNTPTARSNGRARRIRCISIPLAGRITGSAIRMRR